MFLKKCIWENLPREIFDIIIKFTDETILLAEFNLLFNGNPKISREKALKVPLSDVLELVHYKYFAEAMFIIDVKPRMFVSCGTWDIMIKLAVEAGAHNKFIMKLIRKGFCTRDTMLAAAKMGRFDTIKTLYYNDVNNCCRLNTYIQKAVIKHDNVETVKWMWSICKFNSYEDLETWLVTMINFDAVNCYAYFHDNIMVVCPENHIEHAFSKNSVRIIEWMKHNCNAYGDSGMCGNKHIVGHYDWSLVPNNITVEQ